MRIDIPALNQLRTFESAARHLSFTRAAEELHITQGAVSQQIRQLEDELGFKLFHRLTRRIVLTEEGQRLSQEVQSALLRLSEVIQQLKHDEMSGALTVSVLPSFAMKWLVPRLGHFNRQHPEVQLRLHTSDKLIDFKSEDIDVAVRYGKGDYPGLEVTLLMHEQIFPVCSPDLLKEKPIHSPDDLKNHLLIQDVVEGRLNDEDQDWHTWLKAVGADIPKQVGTAFTRSEMVLEAAIEGQGVAMTRFSLAELDLKAGRVVRPFHYNIQSEYAYYIVCPPETAQRTKVGLFKDWLLSQVPVKAA